MNTFCTTLRTKLNNFFALEATVGILLMIATIIAIIIANTPLESYYQGFLATEFSLALGDLRLAKPLLLWINDGFMAIFFFLIGLELKREFLEGELANPSQVALPAIGALGGMIAPALIYVAFNYHDPLTISGWAIPAATDIAFALAILLLVGSKVPLGAKVFLTSLAVFDDLGAIIIIALFYTDQLSIASLGIGLACILLLFVMNRQGVRSGSLFILVGLVMWVAFLKSGVHATISGVILALFIPMRDPINTEVSMLKSMEHKLHGFVSFFVLPLFAFANAGLNLSAVNIDQLFHSVSLGIFLGLLIGKPVGVFGFCYVAIKLKIARLPQGVNFSSFFALAVLCGVGFTMSLFIGSLAFEGGVKIGVFDERLGILTGSIVSGIIGFLLLKRHFR